MSFEIAKAGWMMRESAILKRWKRNYFVLYRDGVFKYFEDDRSSLAEEAMVVKQPHVLKIKEGLNLIDTNPPSGHSRGCLLKVKCNDKSWTMCAESPDDMSAWKISLEEANQIPYKPPQQQSTAAPATVVQTSYPSQTYTVYPNQATTTTHVYHQGQVYPNAAASAQTVYVTGQPYGTVVQPAPGQAQTTQTIVVAAEPYHNCGRYGCTASHHHGYYDDWWW